MTDSTLSTSEFFERLDSDFYGNDSTRAKDVTPICWQVYLLFLSFIVVIKLLIPLPLF